MATAWPSVPLGQLTAGGFANGLSPSRKGTVEGRVLTLSAVTRGGFDESAQKEARFDKAPAEHQRALPGKFLVCRGNGNIDLVGRGVVVGPDASGLVFPDTVIGTQLDTTTADARFVAAVWNSPAVRRQIEAAARTTNGTHKINQKSLAKVEIPLPPLPEQRRIAAILDKADAIRHKRRQTIELTEELLRSAFLEMFGDPVTNPKAWPVVKLADLLATPPRIGTTKPATADGAHPVVRVGEIGGRQVAIERCGKVTLSDAELERYRCRSGDFLLARAIGSASHLGKASILQDHDGVVVFDSHVMRLRFEPQRTSPFWFSQWMRTRGGRALFMRQAGRTAVQFNVNAKQIARVRVPIPDRELQERFLDVARAARQLQARERTAANEADDLFHSLAQRAFRGEL